MNQQTMEAAYKSMHMAARALKRDGLDFDEMSDEQRESSLVHSQTKAAWLQFKESFETIMTALKTECPLEREREQEARNFSIASAFKNGMPSALAYCLFKYTDIRPIWDAPEWRIVG